MSLQKSKKKRLLLITQVVDTEDLLLGFFHRWIEELAPYYEQVEIICLKEGNHDLPHNVTVHSLGKEKDRPLLGSITYAVRFYQTLWKLRGSYDAVFVHMNQEYVLLGAALWKVASIPVYMWRNHYKGSFLTDIAVLWCTKVFCTSIHSYIAKFKKTILMPVGVDTERFHSESSIIPKDNSILFFARIAPSKRSELYIEALRILESKGVTFSATLAGSPLQKDETYYEALKRSVDEIGPRALSFIPGVKNTDAPDLYQAHKIFVNCSPSGMYDKMIFEAAACGVITLSTSEDWKQLAGVDYYFDTAESLAHTLTRILVASGDHTRHMKEHMFEVARQHSLLTLAEQLARETSLS